MSGHGDGLLILRGVTRRFGTGATAVTALDDVSLRINYGQRVAVVGPSGSGKTTLLSLAGFLDAPDEGEILFEGKSTAVLSDDERADLRRSSIGFVFQLFHLIPALSAIDNVLLPLTPYRKRRDIEPSARRLLSAVGLDNRLNHLPRELSGGEQQRVALARALINQPALLLADEPTGNLDTRTSRQVIDLLVELHSEREFALVVATHDRALARSLGNQVALLDGRLDGTQRSVKLGHGRSPRGVTS